MVNNVLKKLQLDKTIKLERNTRGAISSVVLREGFPDEGIFGQRLAQIEGLSHGTFWKESIPGRGNQKYKGPAAGSARHVQGAVRGRGPSVSGR